MFVGIKMGKEGKIHEGMIIQGVEVVPSRNRIKYLQKKQVEPSCHTASKA